MKKAAAIVAALALATALTAALAGCAPAYVPKYVPLEMYRPAAVDIGGEVFYLAVGEFAADGSAADGSAADGSAADGSAADGSAPFAEAVRSFLKSEISRLGRFSVVDAAEYDEVADHAGRYRSPSGFKSPFARALLKEPETIAFIEADVYSTFKTEPAKKSVAVELATRDYTKTGPLKHPEYVEKRRKATIDSGYVAVSAKVRVVFKVKTGRERNVIVTREYTDSYTNYGAPRNVPPTIAEIESGFALKFAKAFAAEISPGKQSYGLKPTGGDIMARNLIRAGAFYEGERRILAVLKNKEIPGGYRAENLHNLGISFEARGMYETAAAYYSKAYALDSKSLYRDAAKRAGDLAGKR